MTLYATEAEYALLSRFHAVPNERIEQELEASEREIDSLTYGRIRRRGFDQLTELQQALVKQAVVDQADFRAEYADALENPLASYSVNGVSMAWDTAKIRCYDGVYTSGQVSAMLAQTGLTYRGVS